MLIKTLRGGIIFFFLTTFLLGGTMELRSPIKITRTKEEKKAPPQRVVVAPLPPAPSGTVRPKSESVTMGSPSSEQVATIRRKAEEGAAIIPEFPPGDTPSQYQANTFSSADIVIIAKEYLAGTPHKILGKVTVQDVSQNGFTKKEARDALKFEAFREFGPQAKGIINVGYKGETSLFGSKRYYEANGDVVTWEEKGGACPRETATLSSEHDETMAREKGSAGRVSTPLISVEPLEGEKRSLSPSPGPEGCLKQGGLRGPGEAFSPASILILSDQDLVGYNFWVLGKAKVRSKAGFRREQAKQALKVKAFRQYGGQARGIINITYKKKKGLFGLLSWRGDKYSEASGYVVTWQERKKTIRKQKPVSMPPPAGEVSEQTKAPETTAGTTSSPKRHLGSSPR